LPKAKCFESGRWSCKKEHEHDRSIVAAAPDNIATLNKKAARALLLVVRQRYQGSACHSVQNQLLLAQEANEVHQQLDCKKRLLCTCCGQEKDQLECCKLDASSFFTKCPRSRCIRLAIQLIEGLISRGVEVVWLSKEDKSDKFAKGNTPTPQRYTSFALADVIRILRFCEKDSMVLVGQEVWLQLSGLAQGSALSPVLTRMLLDESHAKLWKSPEEIAGLPLHSLPKSGKPLSKLLALLFHVDDSIWWGYSTCSKCIILTAKHTWPQEVGLTIEGTGPRVVFLHCEVDFAGGKLTVHIRNQNASYARGQLAKPAVCGIPPFIKGICSYRALALSFSTRLWLVSGIYTADRVEEGIVQIVHLSTEVLRLGWPAKHIISQLYFHRNHRFRWFHVWTAACGVWLRRNRLACIEMQRHADLRPDIWEVLIDSWVSGAMHACS
jgi:hypothetical protein